MVIDIHAHVCAAPELYQWKALQISARGAHGYAPKKFSDECRSRSCRHQAQPAHYGLRRNRRTISFAPPVPTDACREAAEDGGGVGRRQSRLHRATGEGVPRPLSGRVRSAASSRRTRRARLSGARPLREATRFRRPVDRYRPRRRRQQHAHSGRRILVSAMGKDGRPGCAGPDPLLRLQARPRDLQPAFHQRREPGRAVAGQLARARRFPQVENHRGPRRRLDSLPDRPLAGRLRDEAGRRSGGVQSPPAIAVLRHLPARQEIARDADRHRRQPQRAVRHGKSRLGIGRQSGHRQELRRHQAADRFHRHAFRSGPPQHLRRKRAPPVYARQDHTKRPDRRRNPW